MKSKQQHRKERAEKIRQNHEESEQTFGVEVETIIENENGSKPTPEEYHKVLDLLSEEANGQAETSTDPLTSGDLTKETRLETEFGSEAEGQTVADFDLGSQLEFGTRVYSNPLGPVAEAAHNRQLIEEAISNQPFRTGSFAVTESVRNRDPDKGPTLNEITGFENPIEASKKAGLPTDIHYYYNYILGFGPQVLANSQIAASQMNATISEGEDADQELYEFLIGGEGEPGMFAVEAATKPGLTSFSPLYDEDGNLVTDSLRRGNDEVDDAWTITYSGSEVMEDWEKEDRHGFPSRLVRGLESEHVNPEDTLEVLLGHQEQYTVILYETPDDPELVDEAVEITGQRKPGEESFTGSDASVFEVYRDNSDQLILGPHPEEGISMDEYVDRMQNDDPIPVSFYSEPDNAVYEGNMDPSELTEDQKDELVQRQYATHNSTIHWDLRLKQEGIVEFRADPNAGPYNTEVLALQAYESQNHGKVREAAGEAGVTNQNATDYRTTEPWEKLSEDIESTVNGWSESIDSLGYLGSDTKRFVEGSRPVEKQAPDRGISASDED